MFRIQNIKIVLVLCSVFFWFTSCDTRKGVDRESVKDEMESRKLKRISEGEMMVMGEKIGSTVLAQTQKTFQEALMKALGEKGVAGAVEYCHLNAYELVKRFEDSLGVEIKRVTNKPRNPKDTLSAFEKEVFEAYQYSPEDASAQLQELDQKTLIYNKPIMISNGACLNCHGKVGSDISEENYQRIQSLYPEDKAINYEVGDLRGMWSIKIPKKTVVDQL